MATTLTPLFCAEFPPPPRTLPYAAQAERFIVIAELASKHAKKEISDNTDDVNAVQNYHTFEGVAVAVNHGFAIELLLKGIRLKKGLSNKRGHDLKRFINEGDFSEIKEKLLGDFNSNYSGHDKSEGFDKLLDRSKNIFADARYHFEEGKPRTVNMDFTSFLAKQLRSIINDSDGL